MDEDSALVEPAPLGLDPSSLRALAHPTRVRILSLLTVEGPATSAQLAHRLAVHSGSTSWHLAKLAEAGLIIEDPDRGTRRERWWQAAGPGWSVDAAAYLSDPETRGDALTLLAAAISEQFRRAQQFLAEDWDARWRDAWILESSQPLLLDPDGLSAMREELRDVLARYAGDPRETATSETVLVQLQGFPVYRDKSA
ncbi:MAG: helix-turn-helix domain-containing protein [Nocardioidaceae bacterium]